MKRYSVAGARQHFSEVLDSAEAGASVVIERRGRLFSVQLAEIKKKQTSSPSKSAFEWLDPMVQSGSWTWTQTSKGWVVAEPRKRPKRAKR